MSCNTFWSWHHWYWHPHYVMPTVSSMASLHSLGQDDENEVQHNFLIMWPKNVVYMLNPHYCTHIFKKNQNATFIFHSINIHATTKMWPSNDIDMSHMPIISYTHKTTMSLYVPHMNSMQLTMSPQAQVYIISHYWHMPLSRYAYHTAYISTTALLL